MEKKFKYQALRGENWINLCDIIYDNGNVKFSNDYFNIRYPELTNKQIFNKFMNSISTYTRIITEEDYLKDDGKI